MAVDAQGSGSLVLDRVSITDNDGVTVLRLAAPVVGILNSTIYGSSTRFASAIRIEPAASVTMQNVTVAGNSSVNGEVTLATIDNGGTLEIENSILSNHKNCTGNSPLNLGSNLESSAFRIPRWRIARLARASRSIVRASPSARCISACRTAASSRAATRRRA